MNKSSALLKLVVLVCAISFLPNEILAQSDSNPLELCNDGSYLYIVDGNIEDSFPLLQAAYDERDSSVFDNHQFELGQCAVALGLILNGQGDLDGGLEALTFALAIFQENGLPEWQAPTLMTIGSVYEVQNQHEAAIEIFEQAFLVHQALSSLQGQGKALSRIGWNYKALGASDNALNAYEQTLLIWQQIGDQTEESITLNSIGTIYFESGSYGTALTYFEPSLEIRIQQNDIPGQALSQMNIGLSYGYQENYEEAIFWLGQALELFRSLGDRVRQQEILQEMGSSFYQKNDPDSAVTYYLEALDIARELNDFESESDLIERIDAIQFSNVLPESGHSSCYQGEIITEQPIGSIRTVLNSEGPTNFLFTNNSQFTMICSLEIGDNYVAGQISGNVETLNDTVILPGQTLPFSLNNGTYALAARSCSGDTLETFIISTEEQAVFNFEFDPSSETVLEPSSVDQSYRVLGRETTVLVVNDSEESICSIAVEDDVFSDVWREMLLRDEEGRQIGEYIFVEDFPQFGNNFCPVIHPGERYGLVIQPKRDIRIISCDGNILLQERDYLDLEWQGGNELRITGLSRNTPMEAMCDDQYQAGLSLMEQSDYENALQAFESSSLCYQETSSRLSEGLILQQIGLLHHTLGQHQVALETYEQTVNLFEGFDPNNTQLLSDVKLEIGRVYSDLGHTPLAIQQYQDVLSSDGNSQKARHYLGLAYFNQGYYEKAIEQFEQIQFFTSNEQRALLNNVGNANYAQDQYARALSSYQRALANYGDVDYVWWQKPLSSTDVMFNLIQEAQILRNIGQVFINQGRFPDALIQFEQALFISQSIGNAYQEIETYNELGGLYLSQGDINRALEFHQMALDISNSIDSPLAKTQTLIHLGILYRLQDNSELASETFEEALMISREADDLNSESQILIEIGLTHFQQASFEEAVNAYQEAFVLSETMDSPKLRIAILSKLGELEVERGNIQQALEHYNEILSHHELTYSPLIQAQILEREGNIYLEQNQQAVALEKYTEAIAIYEQIRANAGNQPAQVSFVSQYNALYAQVIDLLLDLGQDGEAFEFSERARARSLLDSMTGQEVFVNDYITTLANVSQPSNEIVPGQEIDSNTTSRAIEFNQSVLNIDDIQTLLDDNTTFLSYFVMPEQTVAFIIAKDSSQTIVLDVTQEELSRQVSLFRDFADLNETHPISLTQLNNVLIDPIKEALLTEHIIIAPHSILHYLPFGALTDGSTFLIDKYSLSLVPSATILPLLKEEFDAIGEPFIIGNPSTTEELPTLRFGEAEATTIASQYNTTPLLQEHGTESLLWQKDSQINLLHIAAHARYDETNPLYSTLYLAPEEGSSNERANGQLEVREIYQLNLENTALVVLSACETNIGRLQTGDEVIGLTQAFLTAGAQSIISSLWLVDDEVTNLLMTRFYTYLGEGMGRAQALQQAQKDIRESYPNPFFWSGFVLTGNNGDVPDSIRPKTNGLLNTSSETDEEIQIEPTHDPSNDSSLEGSSEQVELDSSESIENESTIENTTSNNNIIEAEPTVEVSTNSQNEEMIEESVTQEPSSLEGQSQEERSGLSPAILYLIPIGIGFLGWLILRRRQRQQS